uniref:Map kinase phosphatase 6 n=1 Tax=Tetraselmis sp. GSL018 TaxID=582737 RepID=A0A061QWI1_9CHLO|mmetsp:Transcript_31178/g.74110  ORF Transcript_31178/g.74110 Transcript_31178/m.74110 type:complete len:314 (+) Transcript_31178:79-1020(+)
MFAVSPTMKSYSVSIVKRTYSVPKILSARSTVLVSNRCGLRTGNILSTRTPVRLVGSKVVQAADAAREDSSQVLSSVDGSFEELHTFSSYANWLLPNQLMLGRYPFVEPSRCRTRVRGEDQLRTILEAGVNVFISLQAELPDQVDIPIGGKDGFVPYKATADLIASAMSDHAPAEQHTGLRNPWLDSYLPPRKRPQEPSAASERRLIELSYLRFPVTDMDVPSMEVVDSVISAIDEALGSGKKVYLHCWGGRGRAGVVGACYLVKAFGVSAEEALQRVQLAYDTRRDSQRLSPETNEQRQFVHDFAARLSRGV